LPEHYIAARAVQLDYMRAWLWIEERLQERRDKLSQPEIATPAGIWEAFPLYIRSAQVKWDREVLRGLVYITTDCGPLKHWL